MSKLVILFMVLALAFGFYGGVVLQQYIDPDLSDEFAQDILGEAECLRFSLTAPSPRGTTKFAEQVLCGYHFEWSAIQGGVYPKNFAPQPGESNL